MITTRNKREGALSRSLFTGLKTNLLNNTTYARSYCLVDGHSDIGGHHTITSQVKLLGQILQLILHLFVRLRRSHYHGIGVDRPPVLVLIGDYDIIIFISSILVLVNNLDLMLHRWSIM